MTKEQDREKYAWRTRNAQPPQHLGRVPSIKFNDGRNQNLAPSTKRSSDSVLGAPPKRIVRRRILMASKQIGPFAQAWYKWKALRLPWRRRFLIGFDLEGNTFWEFRLTRGTKESSERWRRIVSYPRSTHYSQVKVSPQWHQWLRHTRREPPSLEEQRTEVVRQERMKYLAAEADARWEAKPRVMEAPREQQDPAKKLPLAEERPQGDEARASSPQEAKKQADAKDPWAKARAQGPGEKWQPTAWNPTPAKRRQ
ncbi:hypothetical protein TARUN_2271 [Trichoderma arundinaceum]|uniref:Uncharacterized protein n=1 Tax=Trichoderma arundinaceum TaxID=490622 RepID=A0A395NVT1_TRIAR|nr:hypothetical protein TARUN_2271 [Trichoderma arundinaceum]